MSSQTKRVFFGRYIFDVCEEVYEPAEDTFLLARNLVVNEGERILDMGTGCGILAVLAAEKAGKVVAVDINPQAIACTINNANINNLTGEIETRLGDLFDAIEADEKFDLILFNAPYLVVEKDEGKSWIEKAWAGGKTGREVIDRFIEEAPRYLAESGRIQLVQSTPSNVEKTLNQFSKHKLYATIIDEEKSAFERIILIEAERHAF